MTTLDHHNMCSPTPCTSFSYSSDLSSPSLSSPLPPSSLLPPSSPLPLSSPLPPSRWGRLRATMMPWPGLLEPFTECFGLGLLGSLCAAYLLGVNSFLFIVIFLLVHSAVWFFLDMSLMRTVEVWSSYHNCSTQGILPSPPLSHTHTHTHTVRTVEVWSSYHDCSTQGTHTHAPTLHTL